MVMAIAQRDKVQIQPSGVTALNKLGLSTQVPTKYTYLTSGSGRVLTLGNRTIELKRSVPKNFAFQTVLAALLVQALRTLGQKNVGNQELSTIRKLVNEEEHKDLFVQDLTLMPVWMRKLITDIIDKTSIMTLWLNHTIDERIAMLQRAEEKFRINQVAIEKDWWVTVVLNALFKCSCADQLIFKGGTSLSKGWNLIERFSEDIDLSVSHEFFGIEKTTKNQREKLRKKALRYFLDTVSAELDENLKKLGVEGYHIENVVEEIDEDGKASPVASDKDPSVILVHYESMLGHTIEYIPPRVKIEISCLSMNEPTEDRLISSYIEQTFPGEDAAATATVRTVVPTRTFLEKAFLLCEEFQKQTPRHVRMSRHLYDLERLMDTGFGKQALQDIDLYERIVKHRSIYYAVGYVDYSKLMPSEIDFVPRQELMKDWEGDYAEMCNHFIYGQTLSFEKLLERIKELQDRFRKAF